MLLLTSRGARNNFGPGHKFSGKPRRQGAASTLIERGSMGFFFFFFFVPERESVSTRVCRGLGWWGVRSEKFGTSVMPAEDVGF